MNSLTHKMVLAGLTTLAVAAGIDATAQKTKLGTTLKMLQPLPKKFTRMTQMAMDTDTQSKIYAVTERDTFVVHFNEPATHNFKKNANLYLEDGKEYDAMSIFLNNKTLYGQGDGAGNNRDPDKQMIPVMVEKGSLPKDAMTIKFKDAQFYKNLRTAQKKKELALKK